MRKLSFGKQECSDSGGNESATQQWLIIHVVRLNEMNGLIWPHWSMLVLAGFSL